MKPATLSGGRNIMANLTTAPVVPATSAGESFLRDLRYRLQACRNLTALFSAKGDKETAGHFSARARVVAKELKLLTPIS